MRNNKIEKYLLLYDSEMHIPNFMFHFVIRAQNQIETDIKLFFQMFDALF